MVPKGWMNKTLGDLTGYSAFGPRFSASLYSDSGNVGTIRTTDLNEEGEIDYSTIPYANLDDSFANHFLSDGDLLITRSGSCGIPCIFQKQDKPIIAGAFLIRFVLNELVNKSFLHSLLKFEKVQAKIQNLASGGVQKNLSGTNLKKLELLIPPLAEQKKIAQILSTWDKAITTSEQLLANSQQQKKALMQQLLTGKKRLLDDNGVRFSGEWKKIKLKQLFEFKRGKGLSKSALLENGKHKCILYGELFTRYPEVINEIVSTTNESNSIASVVGDILIPSSTTTTGIDLANATALLKGNVLLGGDINILRPKQDMCSPFFAYLLTHMEKNQIASFAQGITIIHLYGSDLKKLQTHIPPSFEEQQKIAAVLTSADQEIDSLQQKIDALKQEKKALMQQLLTGKRRVKIN